MGQEGVVWSLILVRFIIKEPSQWMDWVANNVSSRCNPPTSADMAIDNWAPYSLHRPKSVSQSGMLWLSEYAPSRALECKDEQGVDGENI